MVFTIADLLNQWELLGVFDFALPFILIFAIIFGILNHSGILGKNRMVHILIASVIGLLALRSGTVQAFFSEIFPQLGIGLAVLLSLIILVGLFVQDDAKKGWFFGFSALGFFIWIIVTYSAFADYTFGNFFYGDYIGIIAFVLVGIGIIIAVAASGGEKKERTKTVVYGE